MICTIERFKFSEHVKSCSMDSLASTLSSIKNDAKRFLDDHRSRKSRLDLGDGEFGRDALTLLFEDNKRALFVAVPLNCIE